MSTATREGYDGVRSRKENRKLRRSMDATYNAELSMYLEDARVKFGMSGIGWAIAWFFLKGVLAELWRRYWSESWVDYGVADAV